MTTESLSSQREEILAIARLTRKDILAGNDDTVKTLRACLLIANDLNKKDTIDWITHELSGDFTKNNLPEYRIVNCQVTGFNLSHESFQNFKVFFDVHWLNHHLHNNKEIRIMVDENDIDRILHVRPEHIEMILATIVDKCFAFLNAVINELQYGGIVEYLMEEIRRVTDNKLATYDHKITEETQSLYTNLSSTNPADWSKVGHSCRKILKLLADSTYPAVEEKITLSDGRTLDVSDACFINRLVAFMNQSSNANEKRFLGAEIVYLESYLRRVNDYSQMAEHNPSIDKYHANMLAIHTYLVISEILRYAKPKGSDASSLNQLK